jgi:hypothetical protein
MKDYQKRMFEEQRELSEKIHRLSNFLLSSDFARLDDQDRNLLETQFKLMGSYNVILKMRMDRVAAEERREGMHICDACNGEGWI